MWDLSSRPGMGPVSPAMEVQSLNRWTAREVLKNFIYLFIFGCVRS